MSGTLWYDGAKVSDDVTGMDEQAIAVHKRVIRRCRYREVAEGSVGPGLDLWMLRCLTPESVAKRLTLQLKPPCAVFAIECLPSRVYVRASRRAEIQSAMDALAIPAETTLLRVPVDEQTKVDDAFTNQRISLPFKVGQWVDIVRGHYRGCIGRVREITDGTDVIVVAVVPYLPAAECEKRRRSLLTLADAEDLLPKSELRVIDNDSVLGTFKWKNLTFKNGLLELSLCGLHYVRARAHKPSLADVGDFTQTEPWADIDELSGPEPCLKRGDHVCLQSGMFEGLLATTEDVQGSNVILRDLRSKDGEPRQLDGPLNDTISVSRADICRVLKRGDHVRLCFGLHAGKMGVIVAQDEKEVAIFSETLKAMVSHCWLCLFVSCACPHEC